MATRIGALLLAGAVTLSGMQSSSADTYSRHVNGKEVIVHTNPVPVILHRAVPPYLGKHVTERQLKSGRLPAGARK